MQQATETNHQRELSDFLHYVGWGDQNQADNMLKRNPKLAFGVGILTDCAGREFKQITGFQYAIWALDWRMWAMIEKYLTFEDMQKQIKELDQGTWIKEFSKRTSWNDLINAMKEYQENFYSCNEKQRKSQWVCVVGREQRLLPAHVIQEYFASMSSSFFYESCISLYPELRDTCSRFKDKSNFDRNIESVKNWSKPVPDKGKLGEDFAWATSQEGDCCPRGYGSGNDLAKQVWDGMALQKLLVKGTEQFEHLVFCVENNVKTINFIRQQRLLDVSMPDISMPVNGGMVFCGTSYPPTQNDSYTIHEPSILSIKLLLAELSPTGKYKFIKLSNIDLINNTTLNESVINTFKMLFEKDSNALASIKKLAITNCKIDDTWVRNHLLLLLSLFNNLSSLSLSNNRISSTGFLELMKRKHLKEIKSINVKNNLISLREFSIKSLSGEFLGIDKIKITNNLIPEVEFKLESNSTQNGTQEDLFCCTLYNKLQSKSKESENPYNQLKSLLNPELTISCSNWIVSLVCKKNEGGILDFGHAMIYLEGKRPCGQRYFRRYHVTGAGAGDKECFGIVADAIIEGDYIKHFNAEKYCFQTWPITNEKRVDLEEDIKNDQEKKLRLNVLYASYKNGTTTINCIEWARKKLKNIGIEVNSGIFPRQVISGNYFHCVVQ